MSSHDELVHLIKDTKKLLSHEEQAFFFATKKEISSIPQNIPEKRKIAPPQAFSQSPTPPTSPPVKQQPSPIIDKPKPITSPQPPVLSSQPIKKEEPKPTPIKTAPITQEKDPSDIRAEKPTPLPTNFNEIKAILAKIAPEIIHLKKIPSDRDAKYLSEKWRLKKTAAPITILSFKENAKELRFLENIAKALDIHFLPARVINASSFEEENVWDHFLKNDSLKLIIARDTTVWDLHKLMKLYRSVPSKTEHFLDQIPLFLLPDLSLYFKQPAIKKSLWLALQDKIQSLSEKEIET